MDYVVIVSAVACFLTGIYFWHRNSMPSEEVLNRVFDGIKTVQVQALKNVIPLENADQLTGFDEKKMSEQTMCVDGMIRFIYTVEEHSDGYLHTVSSQLVKPRSRKYQVQCMLFVMITLNSQLERAGLNPETVKFDISESEMGTQYIEMLLSPQQNSEFEKMLA